MEEIKQNIRRIEISELPKELPDFSSSFEPKDSIIKKWIINWLKNAIESRTVKNHDILPSKQDMSKYLGVSVGTVQNAIRYVEDSGLLKSKQRLGTMVSSSTNPFDELKKSTSKRDKVVSAIKQYIIKNDFKTGKPIPSTRKMSEILGISQNTIRLAYEFLCSEKILLSRQVRGNDSNWMLQNYPRLSVDLMKKNNLDKSDTLVDIVTQELKTYLSESFEIGDKIPSHEELADVLKVSVKTIHDCVKKLNNDGVLLSRRGRYGTILASDPLTPNEDLLKQNNIFSSSSNLPEYNYQRTETKLLNLISVEYKAGDKLPSMKDLSYKFGVSTNTIRKALTSIAEQGYVTFGRGRYGGTFILDVPESEQKEAYQWLSLNPDYIQ